MAELEAYGLGSTAPRGWEAAIYRREPEVVSVPSGDGMAFRQAAAPPTPILHLANFAVPEERGDYGGGAVELMGPGGIFIALLEHDPVEVGTALFAGKPIPWPLAADDFEREQMQRPLPGQAGCQRFFAHQGRAFCLYVAIGSYRTRALLVREVNAALATIEIA